MEKLLQEEKEDWKDVPEYEGIYMVSNKGRIKSLLRVIKQENYERSIKERIMKLSNEKGYHRVMLSKNGKNRRFFVHQLVAMAFIPNPKNHKIINHKNGIRNDNVPHNLEWCTYSHNERHAYKVLGKKPNKTALGKTGKRCVFSKSVSKYDMSGNFIQRYESGRIASIENKICHTGICACARGERKTAGGFKWKYND